jgi:uncharacterized Ntn-hydrolase superfamily protein
MTYSIVARDPTSGEMGVAVQSHWFSVGSIVTWGEAGVGVVATQAFAEPSYGPLGLDLMRGGKSATDALSALLEVDAESDRRQVAMIDNAGTVAVHTGAKTIQGAGHVTGENYSCQANMMLRDTVPDAMAKGFESADGDLTDRLLAALDAAEAEGGDIRGRQSAALLVVRGERAPHAVAGRVTELRVEDHPDPLTELRRVVTVKREYDRMNEGDAALAKGDMEAAKREYEAAQASVPDNAEFTFWRGVMLANFGKLDEAREFLSRAYAGSGAWEELLRRLPPVGLLAQDVVDKLTAREG